jgi:hypothetical protein
MRTLPSSAFFTRLQSDNIEMAELIDLETNGPSFHWTTANNPMTFTLSGTATEYAVFPGKTIGGVRESTDLAVAVVEFVIANSGQVFSDLMVSNDFDMSAIKVGRIFTDTPDMGRMEIFQGKLGDFSYDRDKISGQARSQYGSANTRWPYYNYQDTCVWRFGSTGCGFDVTSVTLALANDSLDTASSTTLNILVASGTLSGSGTHGLSGHTLVISCSCLTRSRSTASPTWPRAYSPAVGSGASQTACPSMTTRKTFWGSNGYRYKKTPSKHG